jgi:sortase A
MTVPSLFEGRYCFTGSSTDHLRVVQVEQAKNITTRRIAKLERILLVLGLLMLGIYVAARIHGIVLSRAALQRFESQQSVTPERDGGGQLGVKTPNFSLWSPKRVEDYEASLAEHFSPAVAVLRVPKIGLEVPVLQSTDDLSLNRGVGLIAGTARPGESGNIGIAGHRDGFFRGLKDVAPGDRIEIATLKETTKYVIDRIVIVKPSDVSVLAERARPSVTLVTCYPFYFVGSAPQRYIVQASAVNEDVQNLHARADSIFESGNLVEKEK